MIRDTLGDDAVIVATGEPPSGGVFRDCGCGAAF